MSLYRLLRDALARVVAIREALEDGDVRYAAEVAYQLELDLAGSLSSIGDDIERVCLDDFNEIAA